MKSDFKPEEKIVFDYSAPKTLRIKMRGNWQVSDSIPTAGEVIPELGGNVNIAQIVFDSSGLDKWDSGMVSFLLQLARKCQNEKIHIDLESLPQGAQKLLMLALAENKNNLPRETAQEPFYSKVGAKAIAFKEDIRSLLNFLGEIAVSSGRMLKGKDYFRWEEFAYIVQRCGADALPLISLISVLVGMILAFVGAVQLKMFGAQVYIADIVGIAMLRVMGAVMAAILMAGRTGASFAAELGIMQTNEEIDAFKTLGVNPVGFLVMPRVLALTMMMPLLTIYADFMGILGGFVVSTGMFNINPPEYVTHTREAVTLSNMWVGLIHSFVFGIIIAVAGCFRGIQCGRSAAGVGESVTSAVVNGITGIVIATAILTFICHVLGV